MKLSRWVAASLATAAVIGGTSVVLVRSGAASLASVRVAGARSLDPAAVRRASGLEPGMNALTLDLAAAERRVERLPLVDDAKISREGALEVVITIEETTAALIVKAPLGQRAYDASGARVPLPRDRRGFPVLSVPSFDAVTGEVAKEARVLWTALRRDERRRFGISWGAVRGFSLESPKRTFVFGRLERTTVKLLAMRAVSGQLPEGSDRIDVSHAPFIGVS